LSAWLLPSRVSDNHSPRTGIDQSHLLAVVHNHKMLSRRNSAAGNGKDEGQIPGTVRIDKVVTAEAGTIRNNESVRAHSGRLRDSPRSVELDDSSFSDGT
jgi:hypothetical protein